MHHAELTESVRGIAARILAELRLSDGTPPRESVLLRDNIYCGRRFEAEHGDALWFFEEDELKIIGADGRVRRVIHAVSRLMTPQRAAA
jgi:hypothetical protein